MAAVALVKFTQDTTIVSGEALKGETGVLVEVENDDNTDVASWQIDLVYVDPASAISTATPLTYSDNGSTPYASITPDVLGSYRFVLKVWDAINRVGDPTDTDIRVFSVPEENGLVAPPSQIWPFPLPPVASGKAGAKPNEMNFGDQPDGWAGDGASDGLLNNLIRTVDGHTSSLGLTASRIFNVGQGANMFPTIQDALTAISTDPVPPSGTNRVVIQVWPGKYTTTSTLTIPAYVGVKGVSKGLVQFQNDTTDLFTVGGANVWFEDFLIEGSATSSLYAFQGNDQSAIHIRRVDMLNNSGASRQKFLRQYGSNWSILFIEDCIIDLYAVSGYAVLLQNSGSAARYVDTIINNVFFDAFHLTSYGGSFQIRGCQDVRIRNSTIRGAATWNTGIRIEVAGVTGTPRTDIRHSYLEGGVPIYGESGTNYYLINSDAVGALTDGSRTLRNSSV